MACGIYLITNTNNGHRYVGKSVDVERRLRDHMSGNGKSYALAHAVKKYGREAFSCSMIEEVARPFLGIREAFWCDALKPEYNVAAIDPTGRIEHSAETRAKMSRALKGRKLAPGHAAAISRGLKGKPKSEEARASMRSGARARVRFPHSEEHRKAIGAGHVGKTHSAERRKANSEAHKGKPLSDATRQAMSRAHQGKTHSEEHRKANSEAQRAAWVKRRELNAQSRDVGGRFTRGADQ